ncbi:hypothetical protein AB205_0092840, partial [Aquarana catesbeiana]
MLPCFSNTLHFIFKSDESEDDEPCAISSKWSYQRQSKRWSRLEDIDFSPCEQTSSLSVRIEKIPVVDALNQGERNDASSMYSSSSGESGCFSKTYEDLSTSRSSSRASSLKHISPDSAFCGPPSTEMLNITTEKLVDKPPGKKKDSLLRKMEKFRLRSSVVKRTPHPKVKPIISSPVLLDLDNEKLRSLNCINISDFTESQRETTFSSSLQTCNSSSPSENSSTMSTPSPIIRARSHIKKRGVDEEYVEASNPSLWNENSDQKLKNERNLHECQIFHTPQGHRPGTFPKTITANSILSTKETSVNRRTGSIHGFNSNRIRANGIKATEAPLLSLVNRLSIYDNVPNVSFQIDNICSPDDDVFSELDNVIEDVNGLSKLVSSWSEMMSENGGSDFIDSMSSCPASPKTVHSQVKDKSDYSDVNFSKLHTDSEYPDLPYITISEIHSPLINCSRESPEPENISMQVERQSAAHMNRIQKLSLLKLTALMDKYSPPNKQGWNWNVPKFIRKIRVPDYKDKNVFGVPLILNVQRTGYPIPKSILQAMEYLRIHCVDQ